MAFMMPGLLTTTLMSGSLFGVALPLVQQREIGLLRRLRVTPVPAAAVAIAHGVTAIMTGLISLVVLMTLGRCVFGMQMAGSWPTLVAVPISCGACALVPMGLLVGSTARDIRTAPAIANLLFFPMMFLSGSAMPFAVLPEGVQRFARLLPTTYLNETYSGVIVRGEGLLTLAGSLAVLLADRRRRHRPDVDVVPLGRHRADSAPLARDRSRLRSRSRSACRRSRRRRSRWSTCPARAGSSRDPQQARCSCSRARPSSTASAAASSTRAS